MRTMTAIAVGLGMLLYTAGGAQAQNAWSNLGNAVKKDVENAAKQQVDETTGVKGAGEAAANPKGAAQAAADAAKADAKANTDAAAGGVADDVNRVKNAADAVKAVGQPYQK